MFHAHYLPENFLGNRRSCLSAVVTAGKFDKTKQETFDHYAKNLNDMVVDGIGAGVIIDDDLNSTWDFDYEQTDFAVELVNTDAEMLGEDVESTKLRLFPIKINRKDISFELLTRRESRGVVRDIFHRFAKEADDEGSLAAITGSPGIGKSWTLFYALQQALLYDGATVLFFFQKKNNAVMYLRRNNKLYAWKSSTGINPLANSNLFNRPDVLVLLDPKEAVKGGADCSSGMMKLLYAASNNKVHFSTEFRKDDGDFQTFLGPPLDEELHVILHRLNPLLKQDVIKERTSNVGNLIRYIWNEKKYNQRVKATNLAVEDCAENPALLKKALMQDDGMSDGKQSLPGTLFQVLPTRPIDLKSVGYEGEGVEYRQRVVLAVNENVRNAIIKAGFVVK